LFQQSLWEGLTGGRKNDFGNPLTLEIRARGASGPRPAE
jgi:hypothetical protein